MRPTPLSCTVLPAHRFAVVAPALALVTGLALLTTSTARAQTPDASVESLGGGTPIANATHLVVHGAPVAGSPLGVRAVGPPGELAFVRIGAAGGPVPIPSLRAIDHVGAPLLVANWIPIGPHGTSDPVVVADPVEPRWFGRTLHAQAWTRPSGSGFAFALTDALEIEFGPRNGLAPFDAAHRIAIDSDARSVALGDLDGDGETDVVVGPAFHSGTPFGRRFTVAYGVGDGTFERAWTFDADCGANSTTLADLDGDGALDLIVNSTLSPGLNALFGDGSGGFGPRTPIDAGGDFEHSTVGDITGDGILDVIATHRSPDHVAVYAGLTGGGFAPAATMPLSFRSEVVTSGDFNGDGWLDVAVGSSLNSRAIVLYNDGAGSLRPGVEYLMSGRVTQLEAADLDVDGFDDLVVGSSSPLANSHGVSFLFGSSTPAMTKVEPLATQGEQVWALDVFDANGDGDLDVFTDSFLVRGNGDGTFRAPLASRTLPANEIVGVDLDGTGLPEVVGVSTHGDAQSGHLVVHALSPAGVVRDASFVPLRGGLTTGRDVGDLDGDGFVDVAIASAPTATPQVVHVAFGRGDGSFDTPVEVPMGAVDTGAVLACADVDADGTDDLVVLGVASQDLGVFLSNGDRTFTPLRPRPLNGTFPNSMFVGELTGDGAIDVAVGYSTNVVEVLAGDGSGAFDAHTRFSAVQGPGGFAGVVQLTAADVDDDGDLDLVTSDGYVDPLIGDNYHRLFPNDGAGHFGAPTVAWGPWDPLFADFDGDGTLDLAQSLTDAIRIALGDGDGTYTTASHHFEFATRLGPALDVDRDGVLDLLVRSSGQWSHVLYGNGDGTFDPQPGFYDDGHPIAVDLDGDTLEDLILVSADGFEVRLLRTLD